MFRHGFWLASCLIPAVAIADHIPLEAASEVASSRLTIGGFPAADVYNSFAMAGLLEEARLNPRFRNLEIEQAQTTIVLEGQDVRNVRLNFPESGQWLVKVTGPSAAALYELLGACQDGAAEARATEFFSVYCFRDTDDSDQSICLISEGLTRLVPIAPADRVW